MCCAYGVEPLAQKLLDEGANPSTQNCYGYTPLLEASHRGFVNIVKMLTEKMSRADIDYIVKEELSIQSPFVSAPAQSALAEAARCGFPRIVQILLDAGASKVISLISNLLSGPWKKFFISFLFFSFLFFSFVYYLCIICLLFVCLFVCLFVSPLLLCLFSNFINLYMISYQ